MIIDDFKIHSEACFRDCPPPCACVCPLGLDVRAVIDKVQRKNFNAAYRLYRNQVIFPAIVSRVCDEPCRGACVRKNVDAAVHLRKIEEACVALARNTEPIQYNVPAKPFSIAVIGAGLSGLSCALKLAARNYAVTVYETKREPGGRLEGLLDREGYLEEIRLQFSCVEYAFRNETPVDDLDSLKADAVYVATGEHGRDFGLRERMNRDSLGTAQPGVFLGGGLLGTTPVESIAHGVRASYSIEKFLKVGAMDGVPETFSRPRVRDTFYSLPVSPAASVLDDAAAPAPENIVREAERCLRCNCSLCHDHCDLMRHARTFPPKMVTDVVSSLGPRENMTQRIGLRMANSCTQCGVCGDVCPEKVDMEKCLLEARRSLHSDAVQPPAYHDFWLRDMHFSNTAAYLAHMPDGVTKSERLFFPGCQLGASDPEYVLKTYAHLLERYPDTSLLLGCCSVPADWAGDVELRDATLRQLRGDWEKFGRPTLILACPTCRKTFTRYFPECSTVSLYEVLAETCAPPAVRSAPVAVFHPCASRNDSRMRESVLRLADRAGLTVEETPRELDTSPCCGFGGHIHMVDQEHFSEIVARRIAAAGNEYITYCTNCRDLFAAAGKACRHILDVCFTDNDPYRKPPSLSRRRRNRLDLKIAFAGGDLGGSERTHGESAMNVRFSEELVRKLNSLLVLEEEVRAVIEHCEGTGEKFVSPRSGLFTGCLKLGVITYWVVYAKDAEGCNVQNVYTHRMQIEKH